jgi:lipopolysaccharide export LptBFGC system permease protein LptF
MSIKILENYIIELQNNKKYKVKKFVDILNDKNIFIATNTFNKNEIFFIKNLQLENVIKIYDNKNNIFYEKEEEKYIDPEVEKLLNILGMK